MNTMKNKSDVVKIVGLKVDAIIGVFEWERAITQPLVIDVIMHTDMCKVGQSDDISDAINYKSVCDDITTWCIDTKAQLIERLAEVIAVGLLQNYLTSLVEVSVAKPTAIKAAESVAVTITRSREEE